MPVPLLQGDDDGVWNHWMLVGWSNQSACSSPGNHAYLATYLYAVDKSLWRSRVGGRFYSEPFSPELFLSHLPFGRTEGRRDEGHANKTMANGHGRRVYSDYEAYEAYFNREKYLTDLRPHGYMSLYSRIR
jgi:hypothetical protein